MYGVKYARWPGVRRRAIVERTDVIRCYTMKFVYRGIMSASIDSEVAWSLDANVNKSGVKNTADCFVS